MLYKVIPLIAVDYLKSYPQKLPQDNNSHCMQPSNLARTVRDRVSFSVQTQLNNKKINDPISLGHRDAFFLAQFNIISSESVLKQPLTDLRVPVLSWPLIDLPAHKLQRNTISIIYIFMHLLIINI